MENTIRLFFKIPADDITVLGEASSMVKKRLNQLGVDPDVVRKATISMFEAEINASIHAGGGTADIEITSEKVIIKVLDQGPGIPDIDMAMKEGYSTAPDSVRQMGFGAGMGLPNMKRYADRLSISSKLDHGTEVTIEVDL
jgi:anti-sigma regulatory factor (Ser/Thr protein kinase)